MIYNGIDLSIWNKRTQQIILKYDDLPRERYEGWMRLYVGNVKKVELGYLLHVANNVFDMALSHQGHESIPFFEEAKGIYELLRELDTTELWHWREFASKRIKLCAELIPRRRRFSTR